MDSDREQLDEMIAYYRARAGEYDQWFLREGRFDRGEQHRRAWFGEVAAVERALDEAGPCGDVLELACGTGIWTDRLARTARRVAAVDASPEVIALNRLRITSGAVEYIVADLFEWQPPDRYDFIFFGFWLSHVPTDRFDAFWAMVSRALKPGGRAFFVDSLPIQVSTAIDHAAIELSGTVERRLNDGRTYRIVKHFHDPRELEARLLAKGLRGYVRTTGDFFLYGCVASDIA